MPRRPEIAAFPRQNALARARQEHGRLVKTLFILRYLQRPEMRRRVGGQLNKGENLNGLRETVNFAHGGAIRHRRLAGQVAQALCLTLVVNCRRSRARFLALYGLGAAGWLSRFWAMSWNPRMWLSVRFSALSGSRAAMAS